MPVSGVYQIHPPGPLHLFLHGTAQLHGSGGKDAFLWIVHYYRVTIFWLKYFFSLKRKVGKLNFCPRNFSLFRFRLFSNKFLFTLKFSQHFRPSKFSRPFRFETFCFCSQEMCWRGWMQDRRKTGQRYPGQVGRIHPEAVHMRLFS